MFTGQWVNDQGSAMELRQDGNTISGFYVTRIGSDKVVEQRHALLGQATGPLIGFVVAWTASGSLTSWAGRMVIGPDGGQAIHAVWHLARAQVPGNPPRDAAPWETFLTYTSVFRRAPGRDAANAQP